MMIDTRQLIPMTEANQNFSRVARTVDEEGAVVIMKNNKPKYFIADFAEYDEFQAFRAARRARINESASRILTQNMEAFEELAK